MLVSSSIILRSAEYLLLVRSTTGVLDRDPLSAKRLSLLAAREGGALARVIRKLSSCMYIYLFKVY